ncbi:Transcription factor IIIC putative zinc-finger domain-containing protein [Entamoeba marina]
MNHVYHATTYTPHLSISPHGNIAIGGHNVCYISIPPSSYITHLESPQPNNPPIGTPLPSNITFVVPHQDTKVAPSAVTSLSWSTTPLTTHDALLVSWNCRDIRVYTERTSPIPPSSLYKEYLDISEVISRHFVRDISPTALTNAQYVERAYSLFFTNVIFTPKNDIAVLSPNHLLLLPEPSYETVLQLALPAPSVAFCSWVSQEKSTTFFAIALITGRVAIYCIESNVFISLIDHLLDADYCIPRGLKVVGEKLFVLKANRIDVVNLNTFNVDHIKFDGPFVNDFFVIREMIFFFDSSKALRALYMDRPNESAVIAQNVVQISPNKDQTIVYALVEIKSTTGRSVFPDHKLIEIQIPQEQQVEVPLSLYSPLSEFWNKIHNHTMDIKEIRQQTAEKILYEWWGVSLRTGVELKKLPAIVKEVIGRRWNELDGLVDLPFQEFYTSVPMTCPLCEKQMKVKHDDVVCGICENGHSFQLCCVTRRIITNVPKAWKCVNCHALSVAPLLNEREKKTLEPYLKVLGVNFTTCLDCGDVVRAMLYL